MLLDDGLQINSIMLAYAHEHDMVIGLLQEFAGDPSGNLIQGMGGCWTGALGYVVFRIQIEGMKSYDEEQDALVVVDDTKFGHSPDYIRYADHPPSHQVYEGVRNGKCLT